jgi:hypothetical protein
MKKNITFLLPFVAFLIGGSAMWLIPRSGPHRPAYATLVQRQYELSKLANEHETLRLTLDGSENATLGLLVGYTRQLAELAIKPSDTQEHRDLVQRLSQAIKTEQSKLGDVQNRRRSELIPLEQRIYKLQQQITAP